MVSRVEIGSEIPFACHFGRRSVNLKGSLGELSLLFAINAGSHR
jgi:hypothetical protein